MPEMLVERPRPAGPVSSSPPIVVVVDHQVPTPDRDSASLRQVRVLELLTTRGAHVVFLPLAPGAGQVAAPTSDASVLQRLDVGVIADPFQQRRFLAEHGDRVVLALLTRPQPAIAWLGPLRQHAPQALIAFDTVDLHHLRLGREADLAEAEQRPDRFRLRAEALTTRALETYLIEECDVTLVVSEAEIGPVRALVPTVDVRILSNIHAGRAATTSARTHRIGFVGNYLHRPNVDAVVWFAEQVLPRVRAELPDATFEVIGSDPTPDVHALAGPGVSVHGWVPDLGPLLRDLGVGVAPLRFGAGVKGKVGEMVAHGVPMVGTPTAFEGMDLRAGLDVGVATDPDDFAREVVAVLDDPVHADRLARSAAARVSDRFSADAAAATLDALFDHSRRRRQDHVHQA